MPPKKPAQPVGGDIDWFVIPIERIRQAAVLALIIAVAAGGGYFLYTRTRRSPEDKARSEIASAGQLLGRASVPPPLRRGQDRRSPRRVTCFIMLRNLSRKRTSTSRSASRSNRNPTRAAPFLPPEPKSPATPRSSSGRGMSRC